MRQYRATFNNTAEPLSRFDIIIECLLIGLLAFMPLAFGVVHAWSEEIVIALSGAIVICFLLKLIFNGQQEVVRSYAYIPVLLFTIVAVIQLVPLPTWLVSIISPNTSALKIELLNDLPNADAVLKSMPLSFYPYATEHGLRLILVVGGIFVVVLNVFRTPAQIKRLLKAAAIIGGVIAIITLAQNLFGNGRIYWFIHSKNSRGYSGPFVNHSHYGQFINLSIGAAIGLVVVKLRESFAGKSVTPTAVFEYLSSSSARLLWLLVSVMGLGAATVFISLTRGGMISMLIAAAFTTLAFASHRSFRSHSWIMVVMALMALGCILYVGFDAVYERLTALRDFHEAEAGRLQILKDIAVAWIKFPLLGMGFGTHSVVYPMFDRSTIAAPAVYAENEYAQVMEETGLIGLSLMMIFGVIVWLSYIRSIRNTRDAICTAAYGLGFGLVAILIHSLSDFGQHLLANAFLSAIFCALLLVLGRSGQNVHQECKSAKKTGQRAEVVYALLVGSVLVWIWILINADSARIAEAHWEKALNLQKCSADRAWQGADQDYAELISHAATASGYEPENVRYQYWLQVYRWRSISQTLNLDTGGVVISEQSMPVVHDIVAELCKARFLCPTYGPIYSMLGQIEYFVLNDNFGAEKIRKGFQIAPCDPMACFAAGCLDVREGKIEDCIEKFNRAMELDSELFKSIVFIYVNYLSRPHLAISVAGNDIGRLNFVAGILEDMQYGDLVEQIHCKIQGLLEAKCSQSDASPWAMISLGNIYRQQGNCEAAIACYRRALMLDYGQVHWRLELAKLLAKIERVPEALQQAKICLHLRPEFKDAEKLVAYFSVHPTVLGEEIGPP